jgi:hypothetical protein
MNLNILDEKGELDTFKDMNGNEKNLEYRYLEYNADDFVLCIYAELPILTNGNKIATSDNINFEVGDEFNYYIVVQSVDETGHLTSACKSKQSEQYKYLLMERNKIAAELEKSTTHAASLTNNFVELTEWLIASIPALSE